MTDQVTKRWGEGVQISTPQMRTMSFSYVGPGELPPGSKIEYEWELEVFRFGLLTIGVEFTVGVKLPDLEGRTVYRINFELTEGSPEAEHPERALRELAVRAAPVTLFPYIRETFGSAALRCGLRFALPFQNVGALFTPDEVELPPAPEMTAPETDSRNDI